MTQKNKNFLLPLLLLVTACTATSADKPANPLIGAWQLVKIQSMDDGVLVPQPGGEYTITFDMEGRASMQVDCNRGTGSYTFEPPSGLIFGQIATTRAMCAPDSIDAQFLSNLSYVRSFIVKDGYLYLATMADGAILEFEPVGEK